jgi:hypothetical protein
VIRYETIMWRCLKCIILQQQQFKSVNASVFLDYAGNANILDRENHGISCKHSIYIGKTYKNYTHT